MDFLEASDAFAQLHYAGWTVRETACTHAGGRELWAIHGCKGESRNRAEAPTQAEAWRRALDEARKVNSRK